MTATQADIATVRSLNNDFARSLMSQLERTGNLSPRQWPWVTRLAKEARAPAPDAPDANFEAIVTLMQKAAKHLKFPKVNFPGIRLSIAGSRARHPGSINVTNGAPYGDPNSEFYGRIHTDGKFQVGRDLTDEVTTQLTALAKDPQSAAADHGHTTGSCCFCNRELTDPRSTDVGYGPVCAANFGLPHGENQ